MKFNKYWFKPKGFGYGATPTTWEGWAVVIVFILYLISLSVLMTEGVNTDRYLLYLFASIVVLVVISKKKTDGEWKWNWGKKKDLEWDKTGKQHN